MSACGAELLLLESVRPYESSNFRTRVPNKRLKGNSRNGKEGFVHENGRREKPAPGCVLMCLLCVGAALQWTLCSQRDASVLAAITRGACERIAGKLSSYRGSVSRVNPATLPSCPLPRPTCPAASAASSETAPQSRSCAAWTGRCLQIPVQTPGSASRCSPARISPPWSCARCCRPGAFLRPSALNRPWRTAPARVRWHQAGRPTRRRCNRCRDWRGGHGRVGHKSAPHRR